MAYSGNSIVDYLNSSGQASDYGTRAKLAASKGIAGYAGTAAQNTQLLNSLRGSTGSSGFSIMGSAPANQNIDFNAIQKVSSSVPSLMTPIPRTPTQLPQPNIVPQISPQIPYNPPSSSSGSNPPPMIQTPLPQPQIVPQIYNPPQQNNTLPPPNASTPPVPTPLPQPTIVDHLNNAGATPAQTAAISSAVSSGNVTPTGVPTNMPQIMGTGSAPTTKTTIPVSGLSTDSGKSVQDIINAALGGTGSTASSTTAGILSLLQQSSPQEQNYNDTATTLQNLEKQLGGKTQDYANALQQLNISGSYQQIQSLNLQAAQMKGELDAFDAETLQGKSNIENQQIPLGLVQGQQAQFQKQRDLTRLAKAAELSATIGLSEAYKGNIDTGLSLMKQSLDLKYAPIQDQIDLAKTQLDIAGNQLDRSDKKTATIVSTLLDYQKSQLADQKKQQSDLNSLGIEAASAGAPLSLVQSALATGDSVTASSILNQYLHATGEKTPGTGTSSGTFSKTQLNNGADNAGLGLTEFGNLPYEVKNFFVNAPASEMEFVRSEIATAMSGSDTPENINAHIDAGNYPPAVAQYLHSLVHGGGGSTSSGGGGGFSSLQSSVGTIGQGIGNAWSAITNWFTGK